MIYTCSSSLQLFNAFSREGNTSQPGKALAERLNTTFRRLGKAPLGNDRYVLRPIMMVCPVVSALKRFKSLGNQYSSLFSKPMARFLATAAITLTIIFSLYRYDVISLYRDFSLNMWMRVITHKFEVFILEVKDALHIWIDLHCRQWTRLTCEL